MRMLKMPIHPHPALMKEIRHQASLPGSTVDIQNGDTSFLTIDINIKVCAAQSPAQIKSPCRVV